MKPLQIQLGPVIGSDYWKQKSIEAMAIVRTYGMEAPLTWEMPMIEFLPDTMPRHRLPSEKYYTEGTGGAHWPMRGVWS